MTGLEVIGGAYGVATFGAAAASTASNQALGLVTLIKAFGSRSSVEAAKYVGMFDEDGVAVEKFQDVGALRKTVFTVITRHAAYGFTAQDGSNAHWNRDHFELEPTSQAKHMESTLERKSRTRLVDAADGPPAEGTYMGSTTASYVTLEISVQYVFSYLGAWMPGYVTIVPVGKVHSGPGVTLTLQTKGILERSDHGGVQMLIYFSLTEDFPGAHADPHTASLILSGNGGAKCTGFLEHTLGPVIDELKWVPDFGPMRKADIYLHKDDIGRIPKMPELLPPEFDGKWGHTSELSIKDQRYLLDIQHKKHSAFLKAIRTNFAVAVTEHILWHQLTATGQGLRLLLEPLEAQVADPFTTEFAEMREVVNGLGIALADWLRAYLRDHRDFLRQCDENHTVRSNIDSRGGWHYVQQSLRKLVVYVNSQYEHLYKLAKRVSRISDEYFTQDSISKMMLRPDGKAHSNEQDRSTAYNQVRRAHRSLISLCRQIISLLDAVSDFQEFVEHQKMAVEYNGNEIELENPDDLNFKREECGIPGREMAKDAWASLEAHLIPFPVPAPPVPGPRMPPPSANSKLIVESEGSSAESEASDDDDAQAQNTLARRAAELREKFGEPSAAALKGLDVRTAKAHYAFYSAKTMKEAIGYPEPLIVIGENAYENLHVPAIPTLEADSHILQDLDDLISTIEGNLIEIRPDSTGLIVRDGVRYFAQARAKGKLLSLLDPEGEAPNPTFVIRGKGSYEEIRRSTRAYVVKRSYHEHQQEMLDALWLLMEISGSFLPVHFNHQGQPDHDAAAKPDDIDDRKTTREQRKADRQKHIHEAIKQDRVARAKREAALEEELRQRDEERRTATNRRPLSGSEDDHDLNEDESGRRDKGKEKDANGSGSSSRGSTRRGPTAKDEVAARRRRDAADVQRRKKEALISEKPVTNPVKPRTTSSRAKQKTTKAKQKTTRLGRLRSRIGKALESGRRRRS